MKKCLVVVDYQYDFVADDGLLTAGKPAQCIEQNILDVLNTYKLNGDDVIFTLDTHIESQWSIHPESEQFNLHCQKGTKGNELYNRVKQFLDYDKAKAIEKRGYAPCVPDIEKIVETYDEIEICGVITDICVLQTAIALYNSSVNNFKRIKFKVIENCCASFSEEKHKFALEYMRNILGF